MSCAGKAVASWVSRDSIQEAREACGGHGYLAVNRIGNLRDTNDANCTYEGDNNCILMQTSNMLLQIYKDILGGIHVNYPIGSLEFFHNISTIEQNRCTIKCKEDIDPSFIKQTLQWLLVYLLKESDVKFKQQLGQENSEFSAKNNSQVYFCRTLAIVFSENHALEKFAETKVFATDVPVEFRRALQNVYMVYGLWVIEKHLGTLFQSNYFTKPCQAEFIKDSVLSYCLDLKEDALLLVAAIAPPDWVLKSPIGHSNGEPLKNLFDAMVTPASQERPSWWKELTIPVEPGSKSHLISSKL